MLYVYTSHLLATPLHVPVLQMPLYLYNGLPGIVLRIRKTNNDDNISLLAHVDTCAAMNTGNLLLHKYIMIKHPSLFSEFVQYDNADPFDPIILQCAVADLVKAENDHGKITYVVCYWKPYTFTGGKPVLLLFGVGAGIKFCSIIGLPTICQWGCMIDLGNGMLISPEI